jgi:hypothetical protein
VIVAPEPASGIVLDFFGSVEQILYQPIVTDSSVVAFDIGVLLRLGWPTCASDTWSSRKGLSKMWAALSS